MAVFVDTNVLIYANLASAPLHAAAQSSIETLQTQGASFWISPQIIREYLANVTRPQSYAQPLTPQIAVARARLFAAEFQMAGNLTAISNHLFDLVERFNVKGKQIHDANIVATMLAYNIERLLTFNVADFKRYEKLIQILPMAAHP